MLPNVKMKSIAGYFLTDAHNSKKRRKKKRKRGNRITATSWYNSWEDNGANRF